MPDVARMALDPITEGWFHHGQKILELVEQHQPKVCVELGTWLGASAIPVARAIRRWGGTLTCVDTWSGALDGEPTRAGVMAPWLLVHCARKMIEAGVSANLRLIPASTHEAALAWTLPGSWIDYLYVDADHSYDAVRQDLRDWLPHMKSGGLILGDDYGPGFPGVVHAWDECEIALGKPFTRYQSDPPDPDGIRLIYGTV